MWDFFRDGGFAILPTALFGLSLIASSVRFVSSLERRFASLTIALSVLTLGSGALGTTIGLVRTFRYLKKVADADIPKVAALGCAESLNNALLALMLFVLSALLVSVGAVRAMSVQAGHRASQ